MDDITTQPTTQNTQPPTTPDPVKPTAPENTSPITKYKYLIIAIVLLLLVIGIGLFIMSGDAPKQAAVTPTPSVAAAPTPTITITVQTGVQMSAQEKSMVETQIKPELQKLITIDYTVPKAKLYGSDWGILQVANPTTDPATIVVQKENGLWKIKLGPGTSFDEAELRSIGAPESLIREINSGI